MGLFLLLLWISTLPREDSALSRLVRRNSRFALREFAPNPLIGLSHSPAEVFRGEKLGKNSRLDGKSGPCAAAAEAEALRRRARTGMLARSS
jgi:hypothetical protein